VVDFWRIHLDAHSETRKGPFNCCGLTVLPRWLSRILPVDARSNKSLRAASSTVPQSRASLPGHIVVPAGNFLRCFINLRQVFVSQSRTLRLWKVFLSSLPIVQKIEEDVAGRFSDKTLSSRALKLHLLRWLP
jgi:hypothetical protein